MGCGLPSWHQLLDAMAIKADLTQQEKQDLKALDVLDQATVLRNRLHKKTHEMQLERFNHEISVMLMHAPCYSLKHALIASWADPQVLPRCCLS